MAIQHDELPIPPELAIDEEPFTDYQLDHGHVSTFEVDSADKAEWAMAKLAAVRAEYSDLSDRCTAYHERIDAWFDRDSKRLLNRAEFFKAHLEHYMRLVREADPRNKSVSLPSGTITSREAKPRIIVTNEAEALAYLKGNFGVEELGTVIKTTEKLLVSGLDRSQVQVEGARAVDAVSRNPVPGLGVEPGGVTFTVKPGG